MKNEEKALKEIFVKICRSGGGFDFPKAIIYNYSIQGGEGVICILKETSDYSRKKVKKIEKEILVDIDDIHPTEANLPEGMFEDEGFFDWVLLSIKKVIRKNES